MIWSTEGKTLTNRITGETFVLVKPVSSSTEDGEKETHERPDTGSGSESSVEAIEDSEPEEWDQDSFPEYGIQDMDRKSDGVRAY